MGGHFVNDDDQTTPNSPVCSLQYNLPGGKRKMIEFEVRHGITNREPTSALKNSAAAIKAQTPSAIFSTARTATSRSVMKTRRTPTNSGSVRK